MRLRQRFDNAIEGAAQPAPSPSPSPTGTKPGRRAMYGGANLDWSQVEGMEDIQTPKKGKR